MQVYEDIEGAFKMRFGASPNTQKEALSVFSLAFNIRSPCETLYHVSPIQYARIWSGVLTQIYIIVIW